MGEEKNQAKWTYTTSTSSPQLAFCDDCGEMVDDGDEYPDGLKHCADCGGTNVTLGDLPCAVCGRAHVEWKESAEGGGPRHPFCLSCGWCAHYQWDERDMRKAEALANAREGWVPRPEGTRQYGATVVKVLPSSPDGSKHCEIVVDSSRVELCPNDEMIVVVRCPEEDDQHERDEQYPATTPAPSV